MSLHDSEIDKLVGLIRDSFRIRANHDPIYIDLGGHLARVQSPQHQVIFGRRGSGKSCLLVKCYRSLQGDQDVRAVYFNADTIKTLAYPDVLIRLLIGIFKAVPGGQRSWIKKLLRWKQAPLEVHQNALLRLLDKAPSSEVVTNARRSEHVSGKAAAHGVGVEAAQDTTNGREEKFREEKIDYVERHLVDFADAIHEAMTMVRAGKLLFLLDDFYLIHREVQPDVIDYLHRLVRDADVYLKVGSIEHRTRLNRYNGQMIGVEAYQDIEPIHLDHTLEDVDATKAFLTEMLTSLGREVGINEVAQAYMNPDAPLALALASGGVPRDYLTIFVEAVHQARASGDGKWLTPKHIYKGAHRVSYRTKLTNLRTDVGSDYSRLERLFADLLEFCIHEKKRTLFLISQDQAQDDPEVHDMIKQLMDYKLIHVIEPDTSAANRRPGRYEAYTLDYASFMEPRRRGIEVSNFWETDRHYNKIGVREAPDYPLARARAAADSDRAADVDKIIERLGPEDDEPKNDEPAQRVSDGLFDDLVEEP